MWDILNHGRASFRVSGWHFQVSRSADGIEVAVSQDDSTVSRSIVSLAGEPLPELQDSFIRGDELHWSMPPTSVDDAGVDLVFLIVKANRDQLVVESTIAIETLSLDSFPQVDIAPSGDGSLFNQRQLTADIYSWQRNGANDDQPAIDVSIFVDERDQASVDPAKITGRSIPFFADFMEKGVIRKVQPWWVFSCDGLSGSQQGQLAVELSARPLPLAG